MTKVLNNALGSEITVTSVPSPEPSISPEDCVGIVTIRNLPADYSDHDYFTGQSIVKGKVITSTVLTREVVEALRDLLTEFLASPEANPGPPSHPQKGSQA